MNRFPLQEWELCRCRCVELVRAAGFPVPRKSACVFCPYGGAMTDWQRFARELPEKISPWSLNWRRASRPPRPGRSWRSWVPVLLEGGEARGETTGLALHAKDAPRLGAGEGAPAEQALCGMRGAEEKATKATGCDSLEAP